MSLFKIILWIVILLCSSAAMAGRGIEVDPSLSYYADRSAASIAAEIGANGYDEVHLIYSVGAKIDGDLVKSFNSAGIRVWICTFLNGVGTDGKTPGGMEMVQRKTSRGSFTYICPNNADFRSRIKSWVVEIQSSGKIYGIDLSGAWFPDSSGPDSESYGCLCGRCTAEFRSKSRTEPPDFFNSTSRRFWKTDRPLYEKWIAYRASNVLEAVEDIVSGIREKCPDLKICTRSLAIDSPEAASKLRENTGCDAAALVKRIKPDMHILQVDQIDAIKPGLSSSYAANCKDLLKSISDVAPSVPVAIALDIGSAQDNRRTSGWMEDAAKSAKAAGFVGPVWHEYSLGDYIYTSPLAVVKSKFDAGSIELIFNKRLDPVLASNIANYTLSPGHVDFARCDGCVINLSVSDAQTPLTISISGLSDDEPRRMLHDRPACAMEKSIELTIEPNN